MEKAQYHEVNPATTRTSRLPRNSTLDTKKNTATRLSRYRTRVR
jgi:hypothetical protein